MSSFRVVVTDDRFGSYREQSAVLSEPGCRLEVLDLSPAQQGSELLAGA